MLFLFAAEYYFPLCECYTVVYPSMINEHLGHFQVLSIKNKAYLKQKKEKSICNDFTEAVSLQKKGSSSRTNLTTLITSMVSVSLSLSHTHTHTHTLSYSVMSDCFSPHGLQPTRLHCPWDAPGKNTGVGCHALLQGIFAAQGSNPYVLCLLHWQVGSLPLMPPGKPTRPTY